MDYKEGIYPKDELVKISEWAQANKEYDINEHEDFIEIVKRDEIINLRYRLEKLKQLLFDSDYKAIKYMEGYISEEEYIPIKMQRQAWRDEINLIQEKFLDSQ